MLLSLDLVPYLPNCSASLFQGEITLSYLSLTCLQLGEANLWGSWQERRWPAEHWRDPPADAQAKCEPAPQEGAADVSGWWPPTPTVIGVRQCCVCSDPEQALEVWTLVCPPFQTSQIFQKSCHFMDKDASECWLNRTGYIELNSLALHRRVFINSTF